MADTVHEELNTNHQSIVILGLILYNSLKSKIEYKTNIFTLIYSHDIYAFGCGFILNSFAVKNICALNMLNYMLFSVLNCLKRFFFTPSTIFLTVSAMDAVTGECLYGSVSDQIPKASHF